MKTLTWALLFIVFLFLVACATTTHKTTPHAKTSKTEHERVVDIQRMDQETGLEENADSPALTLVSEGIQRFQDDLIEEAEWKFEEAVNLDPDYGPAYYWLARVKYRLENREQSLELLKKAERLLKNSDVWVERIGGFRDFLTDFE